MRCFFRRRDQVTVFFATEQSDLLSLPLDKPDSDFNIAVPIMVKCFLIEGNKLLEKLQAGVFHGKTYIR